MSKKSKKELERNREYQKEYYAKKREEILDKRREKYRTDPEYRKKARARDLRNYWLRPREVSPDRAVPDLSFEDVLPKGTVEIVVNNPSDPRHGETVHARVYGTPEIGEILGRNPQTIRKWLKTGVIPEPFLRGEDLPEGHELRRGRSQRLYTEDEARAFYECRELLSRPFLRIKDSLFSRCVHEGVGRLVQGLDPQKKAGAEKVVRPLTGTCMACERPFMGSGDPSDRHHCHACGFRVQLDAT